MEKNEVIELGKIFVDGKDFDPTDYVVSLQGTTFIFTQNGSKKLKSEDRKTLNQMGIKILA